MLLHMHDILQNLEILKKVVNVSLAPISNMTWKHLPILAKIESMNCIKTLHLQSFTVW